MYIHETMYTECTLYICPNELLVQLLNLQNFLPKKLLQRRGVGGLHFALSCQHQRIEQPIISWNSGNQLMLLLSLIPLFYFC